MSPYLYSYITCCCTRTSVTFNETWGGGGPTIRFSFFASNATLAKIQYYVLSKASILIGDIWRERRNRSYPVFLSDHPLFEGILFRRGSTNIIRAPSWAFNGSTVCIPERRVSPDTLLVLQSRRSSKINPPILPHHMSIASPPTFLRFVCRIASLRDRSLQARRRHGWCLWGSSENKGTRLALQAFKENLSIANLTEH